MEINRKWNGLFFPILTILILSTSFLISTSSQAVETTEQTTWYFGTRGEQAPSPKVGAPVVYPITENGIRTAFTDARRYLASNENVELTLLFPAGTFTLGDSGTSNGIFDVSGIKPAAGRLIIRGAGSNATNLIFRGIVSSICGKNCSHVTFQGIHMGREQLTVSQGLVQEITPNGTLRIAIQNGFPTPEQIRATEVHPGGYLRRYRNNLPHAIISENNDQLYFRSFRQVAGNVWEFEIGKPAYLQYYSKGDLIGIKSVHGGQAYYFAYSSDIVFDDLLWTEESRGVFRLGSHDIKVLHCRILKSMPEQCLATDIGGVQIGQNDDPTPTNVLISDCEFEHTGDDSIAFFNADSSCTVRNCRIGNSFARGIFLFFSDPVNLVDDRVVNCPILKFNGPIRNRRVPSNQLQ